MTFRLGCPTMSAAKWALRTALFAIPASLGLPSEGSTAVAATMYFSTLQPGSQLPSSETCHHRVLKGTSFWEPRPGNHTANRTTGGTINVRIDGASNDYNSRYAARVKGDFTGTTDDILQWGACKWGLDEDITKARAVEESNWRQRQRGDSTTDPAICSLIGKAAPCYESYGILQVKGTVHEGTFPMSRQSTPFNVDYALAWQRACFDGDFTWLGNGYYAGDVWGCVGAWYSGEWYDTEANAYIARVRDHLAKRIWEQSGF